MEQWYETTKNFLETTLNEIKEVLEKYSIDEEDQEVVLGNIQELAHQYSYLNSHFVVFENMVKEELGEEKFNELVKEYIHNPELQQHIQENYPNLGNE